MTDSTLRRHAYLILAHKNFGQLRKLLALLDDLRNDIFVHVDRKAAFDQSAWDDACRYSGLVFIEPTEHTATSTCCLAWTCRSRARTPYTPSSRSMTDASSSITGTSRRLPGPDSNTTPSFQKEPGSSGPTLPTTYSRVFRWP